MTRSTRRSASCWPGRRRQPDAAAAKQVAARAAAAAPAVAPQAVTSSSSSSSKRGMNHRAQQSGQASSRASSRASRGRGRSRKGRRRTTGWTPRHADALLPSRRQSWRQSTSRQRPAARQGARLPRTAPPGCRHRLSCVAACWLLLAGWTAAAAHRLQGLSSGRRGRRGGRAGRYVSSRLWSTPACMRGTARRTAACAWTAPSCPTRRRWCWLAGGRQAAAALAAA